MSRLIDEFRKHSLAVAPHLHALCDECGCFGDLEWPPRETGNEALQLRISRDPAFMLIGYTRWLAFARICNELRYYAAPLKDTPTSLASDAGRRASIEREAEFWELAVLPGVEEAVALAAAYLGGADLSSIQVPRTYYWSARPLDHHGPAQQTVAADGRPAWLLSCVARLAAAGSWLTRSGRRSRLGDTRGGRS
jgi:hypothetical protein